MTDSPSQSPPSVRQLLDRLRAWASSTEWVDWLEVGGSFGRGAGDDWSDIDAGIGVVGDAPISDRVEAAVVATRDFAPIADSIIEDLDGRAHLIVVFEDGRQLSLVVLPADTRTGLPPDSLALLDRSGRLATSLPASRWGPSAETVREWSFGAWISVGDAARHAARGHSWRALRSLTEARDFAWQLWASGNDVGFPAFGAVSVSNAELAGPDGIEATHPVSLSVASLFDAIDALVGILDSLTASHEVEGVAGVVTFRIRELRERLST
jgi:hypothetical protein